MSDFEGVETLDFRPSARQTMIITRKAKETDGELSRVELVLEAAQSGPPKHLHPRQREIYTVEDGELTVTLAGDRRVLHAGETIEIPAGVVHGFDNLSDAPVRFRADHLPAMRFEEYIRLVHRTVAGKKATLPIIMRIVRIESSFSETLQPPPGPPRIVSRLLAGLGKVAGYPTGDELSASG
jgi:quercetin dioxygenase-like cupin family protein